MNLKSAEQYDDQDLGLVPGQKVFSKEQMRALLGGIGNTTYYRIREKGLLKYSRLFPGGPAVHTEEQYEEYRAHLNLHPVVVAGPRRLRRY